ncbi:MAG: BspA family leucine-rich repeat surface protein, partial [Erysipelotrichales bacterium]|nr:BspA family leucine-rich repeat surface protein [Erysipelotrichales bacterium]
AFDTSKVYNMAHMFAGCTNLEVLDLSNFDTHSVTSMPDMFAYCDRLDMVILGEKFTVWKDEAYLPEGNWTNGTLTMTNQQLYDTYPSHAEEYAGVWTIPMYPVHMSHVQTEPVADQVYTGNPINPTVVVRYLNKTLSRGVDYTLSYDNNIEPGFAIINVQGYGDYTGTKIVKFRIVTKAPSVTLSNVSAGVKVSWNSVHGADEYRVYRREPGGTWKSVKYTTSLSYTDTKAESGKDYEYRVRGVHKEGNTNILGKYSGAKAIRYIAKVSITGKTNADTGVKLLWSKLPGVTGYQVYRKDGEDGSYKRLASLGSSKKEYIDTSAESGAKYYYKVRGYYTDSGNTVYGAFSEIVDRIFLAQPTLRSTSTSAGVKLTWNKIEGTTYYYIFRKVQGESSYERIKVLSNKYTTYTDKTAEKGVVYYYRVRVCHKTADPDPVFYLSAYSAAKSGKVPE